MSRTITVAQLEAAEACSEDREKFDELFPSGSVRVTQKLAVEHADTFDWEWAAEYLLSDSAYAEYHKVANTAYAEYLRVKYATTWVKYRKIADAPRAEYYKVAGAAWTEYYEVNKAARAEYLKVAARTFAKLYNGGNVG